MYSVLLYNYRVIKVVENFKEGKQMTMGTGLAAF